ncbi:outer membrane protein TolC [Skermanella aerolata]|uniref:TolC family protein n=1 Tax=Skermanella aerolata TaxID=393310 RepID=UPI003D2578E6
MIRDLKGRMTGLSRRAATCVIATMIFAAPAYAKPSDLIELHRFSAMNNPVIEEANSDRTAAEYGKLNALLGFLPSAALVFDRERVRQEVVRTDNSVFETGKGTFNNSTRSLVASIPLFDMRVIGRLKQANATKARSESLVAAARSDVAQAVVQTYLTALAAYDGLRLAEEEFTALSTHLDAAERRLRQGVGNQVDLDAIRFEAEDSRARAVQAFGLLQSRFAQLEQLTGSVPEGLLPLRENLKLPVIADLNADTWIEAAMTGNPELQALDRGADIARGIVYEESGEALPRAELLFSHDRRDTGGSLFGGGSLTNETSAIVRVTVPLFNPRGRGYGGLNTYQDYKSAQWRVNARQREIKEAVVSTLAELRSNLSRSEIFDRAIRNQQTVRNSVVTKFTSGLATITELTDAETDLFDARRAALGARYDYLINRMRLKALTGAESESEITEINNLLDRQAQPVVPRAPRV